MKCSLVHLIELNDYVIWYHKKNKPYFGQLIDTLDIGRTANVVDQNASQAKQSMNKAVDLMVQMEENLKEEEKVLYERANRLRRQSADAFKLMDDVKNLHGQAIF